MTRPSPESHSAGHPARGGHRAVHRRSLRALPGADGPGRMGPGHRVWLHVDGVRMYGPGTHELLQHVEASGSLHQAAKVMGMSYTKAWHLLRKTEEHLGRRLVDRQIGGVSGGGTTLTPWGRELVSRFADFAAESERALTSAFDGAFGDLPGAHGGMETV